VRIPISSVVMIFLIFSLFFSANGYGANDPREINPPGRHAESKRFITIDFDNVDIQLFIKYMSELTGKNFIVDKAVKGNVTIISPTKISEEEAYRVFESVLEVHGFSTVPSGAAIKIVPTATANTQNVNLLQTGGKNTPEDKVVTQLIPLKYASPDEIKKDLAPLLAKTSVMIAHTQSGLLIVTENQANIQRLLAIIKAMDVPYTREQVVVIPLKNGSAVATGKVINTIFLKAASTKESSVEHQGMARVVPYERINALVVMASDAEVQRIRNLVALLDTEKEKGDGNIHVFYLQNANAKELAKVLNELPENKPSSDGNANPAAISRDSKIMADEETNSLIINAPLAEYRAMEEVIKKLDIPRRMVYLEALIMEVDTAKNFSVGVQWVSSDGKVFSGFSGNSTSAYGMISGITADSPALPAGGSLGIFKEAISIGGLTFPNLAAIINAYKNDSDVNIIATPQVLTTDNKKAEISVGENVPYITSKNTTSGTQQDYTNYEYKDVSTKLSITPHINQAGALRLEIKTEVIKLKDSGSTASLTPTTLKRTADTTVIIQDNQTVVLGGIIGHEGTESDYKVPLLGDIPLFGWLFRTHSTNSTKTNMFIFVTPHIIKNPADIARVTRNKEAESGKSIPRVDEEVSGSTKEQALRLSELGYLRLQHNQIQEAKGYLLQAFAIDPENPYALINLGAVYEKEGQVEKAISSYRQVIRSETLVTATDSSDPAKVGLPLRQIAEENLRRLQAGRLNSSGLIGNGQ
jgi:general secretion pathway protein D